MARQHYHIKIFKSQILIFDMPNFVKYYFNLSGFLLMKSFQLLTVAPEVNALF
jgi:hypothetical protein